MPGHAMAMISVPCKQFASARIVSVGQGRMSESGGLEIFHYTTLSSHTEDGGREGGEVGR